MMTHPQPSHLQLDAGSARGFSRVSSAGRSLWLTALLLASLLLSAGAHAQPVSEATKEQARGHYVRGVRRMKSQDFAGAASAFEEAAKLVPYTVVRYNLGIAYLRLGRTRDAVETLEEVIRAPGKLAPNHVARAKQIVAEQTRNLGTLALEVSEPGANLRVDGRDIGRSPMATPLRLGAGKHFVEASKAGYKPARAEVEVTGGAQATTSLKLEPMDLALAQLWIKSALPDAAVWLDGMRIGTTPLRQSVAVIPGEHAVELRRSGYKSAREQLTVGPGATAEVQLDPQPSGVTLSGESGLLALEGQALRDLVVTIDGRRRGPYSGPIALPKGTHNVQVERAGFFPSELVTRITAGETTRQAVVLDPTAETVADHNRDVAAFRGWGIGTLVAGTALVGAGVGITVWNEGKRSSLDDELTGYLQPGGRCDASTANYINEQAFCEQLALDIDAATARRPIGYTLLGVGAASLITGVVLFIVSPDADLYSVDGGGDDPFAGMLRPDVAIAPGAGTLTLSGRF